MSTFLHVLNGDATRLKLESSGVQGEFTVWADVLHDGPARGGLAPDEWRRVRARHLASQGHAAEEEILRQLRCWDAALERCGEYDQVVFWLEHDLFDQLILLRHLHWLAAQPDPSRFRLICIGGFPGVASFTGLGALRPEQLAALMDLWAPITAEQIEIGRRGWELFTGPDPVALYAWRRSGTAALPFLGGALRRHLEDFPSTRDGLARSERQILQALAAGPLTPSDVFHATQQMEERVFMGDTTFWAIARRLAECPQPLIAIPARSGREVLPGGSARLMDAGREVLAGGIDHVELNGVDRSGEGVQLVQ